MKNLLATVWLLSAALLMSSTVLADDREKKTKDGEIHWVSLQEAEQLMAKAPRNVLIDVYTDWCGWCKVMDKKTYAKKEVVDYVNQHFYAIKLNAEQRESITFQGKDYSFNTASRANDFAIELLKGRLSYPTTVLMTPGFENAQPIPGFQDPQNMELVLKYIAEEHYKTTPFATYQDGFKASWPKE